MEVYSRPFCVFVSIMTVTHEKVNSLTVIRNTRRKGQSAQSLERGLTTTTS